MHYYLVTDQSRYTLDPMPHVQLPPTLDGWIDALPSTPWPVYARTHLLEALGPCIYAAEPYPSAPEVHTPGVPPYLASPSVRLTSPFADTWNSGGSRRFAVDCVEHLLENVPLTLGGTAQVVCHGLQVVRTLRAFNYVVNFSHRNTVLDDLLLLRLNPHVALTPEAHRILKLSDAVEALLQYEALPRYPRLVAAACRFAAFAVGGYDAYNAEATAQDDLLSYHLVARPTRDEHREGTTVV